MNELTLEQQELLASVELLELKYYPDKSLNKKCDEVNKFDLELEQTIKNMFYTMSDKGARGLAAPQVGISKRIIVINVTKPMVLINPIIVSKGKETTINEEGCLSFPEYFMDVERYQKIKVVYQNEVGEHLQLNTTDFSAVVLQHEIDHINGTLIVDNLSALKRIFIKRRIKKTLKNRELS